MNILRGLLGLKSMAVKRCDVSMGRIKAWIRRSAIVTVVAEIAKAGKSIDELLENQKGVIMKNEERKLIEGYMMYTVYLAMLIKVLS